MEKMTLYNQVRAVPDNAKRAIMAGRLKGKTDINPMWRIKILTEQFGVCGAGWKYEIVSQWTVPAGNEIAAFCNINLYVRLDNGEWSDPTPGTGGNMLLSQEKNGPYVNDECYKMALTDAISVACKALGVGADVYWNEDSTKYTSRSQETHPASQPRPMPQSAGDKCSECDDDISPAARSFSVKKYGVPLCMSCQKKRG